MVSGSGQSVAAGCMLQADKAGGCTVSCCHKEIDQTTCSRMSDSFESSHRNGCAHTLGVHLQVPCQDGRSESALRSLVPGMMLGDG
jgi:hypothetical protein